MPGETGVTVVTMLVCYFYFACEAAGATSARHSLRPLIGRVEEISSKPRAYQAARSRRRVSNEWRHCEEQRDEAIHSFFPRRDGLLRCRSQWRCGCLTF